MSTPFAAAAARQGLFGLLAVVVSLPLLFALHGAWGLGAPPASGLLLLGGAVVLAFAGGGIIGAVVGASRSSAGLAALFGCGLGLLLCVAVAPLYSTLVIDGLRRDATDAVLGTRGGLEGTARDAAVQGASETVRAAREGRVRERLAALQQQAREAMTPEARAAAAQRARELASQFAATGKTRGIGLFKAGVARLSAFALLLWALVGPPFCAARECRRVRR